MEAVIAAAQKELQELGQRTLLRLREAADQEVLAAKAELFRKEKELAEREERLRLREAREEGPDGRLPTMTPTPTRAGAASWRLDVQRVEKPDRQAAVAVEPNMPVGSSHRSSSANSSPRLSTVSAGSASQLRAMFERKAAKARPTQPPVRGDGKERSGDANRLSFRAQEGPFRRTSSAALPPTPAEQKGSPQKGSPQKSSPTEGRIVDSPYEISVQHIEATQQVPPMPEVASPQRPPRSRCTSQSPNSEDRRQRKSQRPTLHATPSRSLAELLKLDEERRGTAS
mmetsp:Transcript_16070/g.30281  ORF Transcript_16070/g.30281 Transcript_16070/m.30281 type:complete len:285 (-) Transcript_16070:160-1014(-)